MNPDRLKEILAKVPWAILTAVYLVYLAYGFYTFSTDPGSPLGTKQAALDTEKQEIDKLKIRLGEAEVFQKKLEEKRSELLEEVRSLETTRATLSDTLDVPTFMTTVYTEAKRVGLSVVSLKPTESAEKEYYAEQSFDMAFRGVFVQLVGFLDHVSNLQRIVRVENFAIKPVGSSAQRFVELEGVIQLKVYRYLGSAADRIGKAGAGAAAKPANEMKPTTPGGGV